MKRVVHLNIAILPAKPRNKGCGCAIATVGNREQLDSIIGAHLAPACGKGLAHLLRAERPLKLIEGEQ